MLLFIDLKKALDLVEPDLLLFKLFHYGFANSSIQLIRNYFFKRKQKTKISTNKSNMEFINLGAPQGSILGPLFFLIFINDIGMNIENILIELFADDTTIICAGNTLEQ